MDIEIKPNLRPCVIYDDIIPRFGLFHMWGSKFNGAFGSSTVGIVEVEDGSIIEVAPKLIHFLDRKFDEYAWDRKEVKDE